MSINRWASGRYLTYCSTDKIGSLNLSAFHLSDADLTQAARSSAQDGHSMRGLKAAQADVKRVGMALNLRRMRALQAS